MFKLTKNEKKPYFGPDATPAEYAAYLEVCSMKKVKNEDIKWLLVRTESNELIKNLIIDERLFAILVMYKTDPYFVNLSSLAKRLGWHKGADGKIYDRFSLNTKAWEDEFYYDSLHRESMPTTIEQYEAYLNQLQKIQEGIKDGSELYFRFMQYFRKTHIKELSKYNKNLESKQKDVELKSEEITL